MIEVYRKVIAAAPVLGLTYASGAAILALQAGAILFEGIGLSILLPVFQFVQSDGDLVRLAEIAAYWRYLIAAYDSVGVEVTLVSLLLVCFASILARQAFQYLRTIYEARLHETRVRRVRNQGFARFLAADTARHDRTALGDIVNDLVTETPRAIGAVICVVRVMGAALLVLFYLLLLSSLSFTMMLASLAVIGLTVVLLRGLLRKSRLASEGISRANKRVTTFLAERLKSARLIRLSGTGPAETSNMESLTQQQCDQVLFFQVLVARVNTVIEPVTIAFSLLFLYAGVELFALRLEVIGLYLIIMLRLLPVVREALRKHQVVLGFSASLEKVVATLGALAEARERGGGAKVLSGLARSIAFDRVSFRYDSGGDDVVPALDGVTCAIPAQKVTALVGPSGSGKSTLIDLLPRLRDPTAGTITVDGTPLQDFTLESLRRGIAYVPQSPQIFNVTCAEYIRYGKADATDAEVRQAARLAGAASFIEKLPKGYDSLLGEDAVRLSGGEKQRLDLARALVRRVPILILDEPTSHLDADAEREFHAALARTRRETELTIIIIAHRFSTVIDADQILVLEGGRLTHSGTHAQLMRAGGWYAQAFAKQHRGPSLAGAAASSG